uniref:Flowering time control protein FPA-2 n=1 Tax=Dimocarpus longan TaxID=128017 RepID=A0A059VBR3_9ROSI|nr:flowering time control protein FPA2 [Dimocarpus longan]AHZ89703.1 flowering time control protein FPA-2 [Dimocarpus longan]
MSRGNRGEGGLSEERAAPSNNLWVGNLRPETSDSDLMQLFVRDGALDSVATYSSRSFAFVYFKRVDDAKAAKEALQGTPLHGTPIKIEFARPAKPCKHLWVGGISPTVSKEELEEEFLKFGKIEDFKFVRDRSTAYVVYVRLEDASQAMKNMNGKQIGGDQIRVDFLRSQPSRREPVLHDLRDGSFLNRNTGFPDAHLAYKRLHPQYSMGRKDDGQPSNVLWVGYPPSVQIDEQMLHNAMILFGEIERIKSFPSRNYSFVEFRSVDEARRAKEGLEGRLFNDPRITIMYSNSELAPGKDYPGSYAGMRGPRPEMFFSDHPFRPQMDAPGHNHSMLPSGPLQTGGAIGQNMPMRSLGAQGSLDPLHSGPEFKDFHGMQDANPKPLEPNWRRLSPSPGMRTSPAPGIRQPMRPGSGSWDLYDANCFQRDPKRSRLDSSLSIDDATFPPRKIDESGLGLEQSYGIGSVAGRGASGAFLNVEGRNHLSPVGTRMSTAGSGLGHGDSDCIWRGVIAKGGTPVCHARCVPIGKGIGTELPEVVNCSARTGLDMLTKHYADSIGFDIVFFLPDSEDDFASYTEFLRYLGSKDRAGVAKFDDGTTLFLVPPSDFLTKVLKVMGPERLYGVVLKLPQQSMPSSQIVDRQTIPPHRADYSLPRPKDEQVLPVEYNRFLHDDSKVPAEQHFLHASESFPIQPSSLDRGSSNSAAVSQAGVALTPELIATLASFLPSAPQSSAAEGAPPTLSSSSIRPQLPQSFPPSSTSSHGLYVDNASSESAGQSVERLGNPLNPMPQSQVHYYSSFGSTSNQSAQVVHGSTQFQESNVSLQHQGTLSSRPLTNFSIPPQSAHIVVSPSVTHQYQYDVPPNNQRVGMVHATDASTVYASQAFPQTGNAAAMSNPVTFSQPPNIMPFSAEKVNLDHPNQVQQLQSVLSGAGQGMSEDEVDKNQRYQSTLQFAANLLLQIQNQQQQQQTNTPGGRGTGNQL